MTVTDQIKFLDRKIKQNEAQYDLDRKAAKISALSSNNLNKYEYLNGEDLDLKPSTLEQAKFEYSPFGKIFNKRLDEEDKKEGLFKRLKNIEKKNEQLLKTTKNKTKNIKEVTDFVEKLLSLEANALIEEIRTIQKNIDYKKLKITGGNNVTYDFSDYKTFKELFRDLYYRKMTIDDAEHMQDKFNSMLGVLSNYTPKAQKYIEVKNKHLDNVKNFYEGREKIIEDFKNGIFPLNHDDQFEEEQQTSKKFNKKELLKKPTITDVNEFNKLLIKKETGIKKELFKNYFNFQMLIAMLEALYDLNDKRNNDLLVKTIKSGLIDLENEIEKMSENEIDNEKPYDIVDIVEEILKFIEENYKRGHGLKILTPNQMLSRLPITLA